MLVKFKYCKNRLITSIYLKCFQIAPYVEDKFYSRPGSHVAIHGGAIPIQQPPQVF
jgi:hypothetical protein